MRRALCSPQCDTECVRPIMRANRSEAAATPTSALIDIRAVDSVGLRACAVAGSDPHKNRQTTMTITEMVLAAQPEERLTLTALAHQEKKAPSTPHRWATKRVRGIRLPTAMVGSKRMTTKFLFQTWCERLTATADNRPAPQEADAQPRNDQAWRAEQAEAELKRLGLEA